mmetsp:Transcript_117359/g.332090  ORF Transcript_117359/g.332090 Transcript_117359/m.332090 type:complete len:234 (-) Transcript_117359:206-907(-)
MRRERARVARARAEANARRTMVRFGRGIGASVSSRFFRMVMTRPRLSTPRKSSPSCKNCGRRSRRECLETRRRRLCFSRPTLPTGRWAKQHRLERLREEVLTEKSRDGATAALNARRIPRHPTQMSTPQCFSGPKKRVHRRQLKSRRTLPRRRLSEFGQAMTHRHLGRRRCCGSAASVPEGASGRSKSRPRTGSFPASCTQTRPEECMARQKRSSDSRRRRRSFATASSSRVR